MPRIALRVPELTITIGSSYHYSKRKVFPARMGDFLGMKVPVPKSVRHVLKVPDTQCCQMASFRQGNC